MLANAEIALFDQLLRDRPLPSFAPVIFILGSPRTGSTLFYQALVRAFRLPYLCNLANDLFAAAPALVAPLLQHVLPELDITFTSAYGKTQGPFQPSEGSGIVRRWCGGGHPSQVTSTQVLPAQREHMARTLAAYHAVFRKPIVIKNAWNCFRVRNLAELFPNAYFLWIRRDLTKSSLSDLAARYTVHGDPHAWNSATPACVDKLRELPYWAQVVENQYEYSHAVEDAFQRFAPQVHGAFWHEDFLKNPAAIMDQLAHQLEPRFGVRCVEAIELQPVEKSPRPFRPGDEQTLKQYVEEHQSRFQRLHYAA